MAAIAVRESAEAVYRGGRLIACFPRERDRQLGILKSRRRVEKIGGGSRLGHDTQPEIIVTACREQKVRRSISRSCVAFADVRFGVRAQVGHRAMSEKCDERKLTAVPLPRRL